MVSTMEDVVKYKNTILQYYNFTRIRIHDTYKTFHFGGGSEGFKFKEGAVNSEQRFWLEASTLSNRGEMRQHLPTGYGHTPHCWLEASTTMSYEHRAKYMFCYWLPAS